MTFVRIPAGEFVMGSSTGEPDARPTFVAKIEKGFWMSELEVSNAQMRALIPSHDSKFIDQMWKDHVVAGYAANRPEQPAIRMSYNTAMEYCEKLSAQTGLKVTLPTEEQWEWACRAGSSEDFWYGNLNSDFGNKENLADKTTLEFAVTGEMGFETPKGRLMVHAADHIVLRLAQLRTQAAYWEFLDLKKIYGKDAGGSLYFKDLEIKYFPNGANVIGEYSQKR